MLCDNKVISIKREEVFNQIFTFLDQCEIDNKLKEMNLQILVRNEEYSSPEQLRLVQSELEQIGSRNLWNGIFLLLITRKIHKYLLVVRRILAKLIRLYILESHQLQIVRYNFIYLQSLEALIVEELNDLRLEINNLLGTL